MIDTVSTIPIPHPTYVTTGACETMACAHRADTTRDCRVQGCAYRWARAAAEDRARREEKDAAAKHNV